MLEERSWSRFVQGSVAGAVAVAVGLAMINAGLFEDDVAAVFALALVVAAACLAIVGVGYRDSAIVYKDSRQLTLVVLFSLFGLAGCSLWQFIANQSLDGAATAVMCIRWLGLAGLAAILLLQQCRWIPMRSAPGASLSLVSLLVTLGILIGPVSIAGWYGQLPLSLSNGFLLAESDIRIASLGVRLSGFLQYPNVQGVFSAAMLLLLLAVGTTRSVHRIMLLASACLPAPLLLTLLLAESRGAALACAAGFAAGCLLLRGRRLALWLASAGWASVCAALACRIALAPALAAASPLAAAAPPAALRLAALLGCFAAGAAGLAALRSRLLAAGAARHGRAIAASASLLAGGLAALAALPPQQLYARLGAHYETAASRASLYQEALRLWREAPLVGRGGDTWRQLAGSRFGINEVHSGYLDILLNHGLIGLSLVLLMLTALLLSIWRASERRIMLAPMLALLLHAAIDFDMSYGCWWLLLFAIAAYGTDLVGEQVPERPV